MASGQRTRNKQWRGVREDENPPAFPGVRPLSSGGGFAGFAQPALAAQMAKMSSKKDSAEDRGQYLQRPQDTPTRVRPAVITGELGVLKPETALGFTCTKCCQVGSSALMEGVVLR